MKATEIKRVLALLRAKAEYTDRDYLLDLPVGFKKSFEGQEAFRGWINYHVTWDVSRDDPWTVIPRKMSLVAEWHRELMRIVPIIAPDGTVLPL